MDEFHSFADPERGIVWELSLACCRPRPPAAAVGHGRQRGRVPRLAGALPRPQARAGRGQGTQGAADLPLGAGRVPRRAARATWPRARATTARRRRWSSASTATSAGASPRAQGPAPAGRAISGRGCNAEVNKLDWTQGVGPKLKQMLRRGVGVHHAGTAAQVPPRRRGPVRAQAAGRGRLHRDAGGGHQPAGALGGADLAGEGAAAARKSWSMPARPIRSSAGPAGRSSTTAASSSPWPTRTTCKSCAGRRSTTRSRRTRTTRACSRRRKP